MDVINLVRIAYATKCILRRNRKSTFTKNNKTFFNL